MLGHLPTGGTSADYQHPLLLFRVLGHDGVLAVSMETVTPRYIQSSQEDKVAVSAPSWFKCAIEADFESLVCMECMRHDSFHLESKMSTNSALQVDSIDLASEICDKRTELVC
jgi:hypothetical protein